MNVLFLSSVWNFQRIAYNTALWKFSTGEDCHCWEGQHQMICWSPNSHTSAQNKQLKLDVYSPMLKYKHIHSFKCQYQCLAGPGDTQTSGQMSPDTGQTSLQQTESSYILCCSPSWVFMDHIYHDKIFNQFAIPMVISTSDKKWTQMEQEF